VTFTDSVAAALARPRGSALTARRAWLLGLVVFGAVVLIPTWIVLPPDDEGVFLVLSPTLFQAKHLFSSYPFWNPFVEFGGPHPGSESLIFHPFVLLLHWASLGFSIGLLYQVQLWIGLLSTWAVGRYLGLRQWIAALCAFTFALGSVTLSLLYNFWPDLMVAWTLSPLVLLLTLKLLDAETRSRRAFYSVATGLCGALMILDGHTGVFPTFGIAFIAFLIGDFERVRRVWPWLLLAAGVLIAAAGTRVYDLALETARTPNKHAQQVYPFDFSHFFLYPIYGGAHGPRNVAFGAPFAILAIVGLFWPRGRGRHALALRLGLAAPFLAWFMPVHWIAALSGNWLFGQPLVLFAIVVAGVALNNLWERYPRYRLGLAALAVAQVAILLAGFSTLYRHDLQRASDYLAGKQVPTLKNTFKQEPIYRWFEQRPDHSTTRALMTPGARLRLWRTLTDYQWSAWAWHGLRLVNGQLRGDDVSAFQETKEALHGEIRGEQNLWEGSKDDLPQNRSALDALNIGYVLATPGEKVAPNLVPVKRFVLPGPKPGHEQMKLPFGSYAFPPRTTIVVYRNPDHWPDAQVVAPAATQLDRFTERGSCQIPGLLCDDLTPIERLGRPGVTHTEWHGTTLHVDLSPSPASRVLMVSQMYRPGWRAQLSDGRTVPGFRLFTGVTGFRIPAGTTSATISFHPTARIVFAAISWATVVLAALFLIAFPLLRRRRKPPEAPRR
jgi:hypothetical protein